MQNTNYIYIYTLYLYNLCNIYLRYKPYHQKLSNLTLTINFKCKHVSEIPKIRCYLHTKGTIRQALCQIRIFLTNNVRVFGITKRTAGFL